MLLELTVDNLLLMEHAELRLGEGLNVLTGETGAGKTLLAQALDLLLGGRAGPGIVREGAAEAYVEGVFSLPAGPEAVAPDAEGGGGAGELIPDDAEELVLARRVWPDGRTRAYVCGRSATVRDLRELGAAQLSFYGQHEHRRLMVAGAQIDALDRFCGPDAASLRADVGAAHERVRAIEARREALVDDAGGRARELDLLAFELREIDDLAPAAEEEIELTAERDRLRHIEALREGALIAAEAVAPELSAGDELGAAALLARAAGAVEPLVAVDGTLRDLAARLEVARLEVEDAGAELRSYLAGIDAPPGRLEFVQERLAGYARLARKHGGTVAEVLAHAERCRARIGELEHGSSTLEEVEAELADALAGRGAIAGRLGAVRREAAPRLAEAVRERLAELAMAEARFDVVVDARPGGCGPRGADAVEFQIAPNPGLPIGPLRDVASGGELSRVMLALLSVAHGSGDGRADDSLLVFDEIDAGIGGHTARAVGEHLRALARGRQVLCITHLPQVAALAERHFSIVKDASRSPAVTSVTALSEDAVVAELVRMLGADAGDRAARGHVKELLRAA